MKKLLAIILATVLCLSFAACAEEKPADENTDETKTEANESVTDEPADSVIEEAYETDFDGYALERDDEGKLIKRYWKIGEETYVYDEYEYDENGFLIKRISYEWSETVPIIYLYENDEKGNPVKETVERDDGTFDYTYYTYEYDAAGNTVKKTEDSVNDYSEQGTIDVVNVYEYDENNNVVKHTIYDAYDLVIGCVTYDYDNNELVKLTDYHNDGRIRCIYEYENGKKTNTSSYNYDEGKITVVCTEYKGSIFSGNNIEHYIFKDLDGNVIGYKDTEYKDRALYKITRYDADKNITEYCTVEEGVRYWYDPDGQLIVKDLYGTH